MKSLTIGILSTAMFMAACADPAANKPKAVTTDSNTAASNNTAAGNIAAPSANVDVIDGYKPTGTVLNVTPENSKIEFTGSKVTGKHDGGFKNFKGIVDLIGDKAEGSRVLIEIDTTSIFTDSDGLTTHLKTPDFFDTANYPKASFVSTGITGPPGGTAGNYTVSGDFTIRGVKKSITFPASIVVTPQEVGVAAEFSINRKDFGMAYAGKADDLIRDDVVLRLNLKLPRSK